MKKRFLCLFLTLAMLFPFVSCASKMAELPQESLPQSTETETTPAPTPQTPSNQNTKDEIREVPSGTFDPTGFCVGFGRYQITPPRGTPMSGYGNESTRRSTTTLDHIYASCVAVSDGENTALFFSVDMLAVSGAMWREVCTKVEEELGISSEFLFMTATHTHSGGSSSMDAGGSIACARMVKAAKDAVATLDRAEMYIGDTQTEKMAYVRRYLKEDGTYIYRGKLPKNASEPEYRHETDADNQMQIIRFVRANQKDVVMVNWTCHVTTVGGMKNTEISSDWVGSFREEVEESADVYFAFFQGAAGNVTPGTKLVGPKEQNNAEDYQKHGRDLAQFCLAALPNLTKIETGKVRAMESTIIATRDSNVEGYNLEAAQRIAALFENGQYSGEIDELCREYGYASHYHARSVLARSQYTEEDLEARMNLVAIAIGDVAFAGAPFEMFDTSGMQVKDASPYTMTFMCGYTNGSFGYIPNQEVFPNHQYEVDTCKFVRGTAEQVVAELGRLLNEMR